MPVCEIVRKAILWTDLRLTAKAAILARILVRSNPAIQRSETTRRKARSVPLSKAVATGMPLLLIGIKQRGFRLFLHDECQLPCQIASVLQAGIHALGADGTVDVSRIAEEETTMLAEAHRAAMVNSVGGEPSAGLDGN